MHSIGCNQVLIDYGDNNKYLLEAAVLSFFDSIIYKIFQKLRKDDSHVRLSVQASQRSQRTMDAYVSFKTLSKYLLIEESILRAQFKGLNHNQRNEFIKERVNQINEVMSRYNSESSDESIGSTFIAIDFAGFQEVKKLQNSDQAELQGLKILEFTKTAKLPEGITLNARDGFFENNSLKFINENIENFKTEYFKNS